MYLPWNCRVCSNLPLLCLVEVPRNDWTVSFSSHGFEPLFGLKKTLMACFIVNRLDLNQDIYIQKSDCKQLILGLCYFI